jgi:hypothetical protein
MTAVQKLAAVILSPDATRLFQPHQSALVGSHEESAANFLFLQHDAFDRRQEAGIIRMLE